YFIQNSKDESRYASVYHEEGKNLYGREQSSDYYQQFILKYANNDDMEKGICTLTESQHQDSMGVAIIKAGEPVVAVQNAQKWQLTMTAPGFYE
ncbi:hypothetical protein AZE42_07950, partial [Rhizopogon vesiculosus]